MDEEMKTLARNYFFEQYLESKSRLGEHFNWHAFFFRARVYMESKKLDIDFLFALESVVSQWTGKDQVGAMTGLY